MLWRKGEQPVGVIAKSLALGSSTLAPLLKRFKASGLVRRQSNTHNKRQVLVSLTEEGAALRGRVGVLGDALRATPGRTAQGLARLNDDIRHPRSRIYADSVGGTTRSDIGARGVDGLRRLIARRLAPDLSLLHLTAS